MAEKGTLLVADGDELARELVAKRMERLGWDVARARGLEDAVEALSKRPSIILAEVRLLGASGYDLVRRIREHDDPSVASSAVLIVSALSRTTDIVEGLRAGADDYVSKPFDFAELEARIEAVARRCEGLRA